MGIIDLFKKKDLKNEVSEQPMTTSSVTISEDVKEFDLNIEKILESWEVYHAIREIIANALDEQILTNTKDIVIKKA